MSQKFIQHEDCLQWYETLDKSNLILSFKGEFNHDLVKAILFLTEQEQSHSNARTSSRIFGVLVESLQNICKHGKGSVNDSELKPGIILIGREENTYTLGLGNHIDKSEMESLSAKIDKVNSLDEDGLREYQNKVLMTTELSNEGNAGIGLIFIARKTTGNIIYSFKEMDEETMFFSMQLSVES